VVVGRAVLFCVCPRMPLQAKALLLVDASYPLVVPRVHLILNIPSSSRISSGDSLVETAACTQPRRRQSLISLSHAFPPFSAPFCGVQQASALFERPSQSSVSRAWVGVSLL